MRKALERGLKPVVVINKIDRPNIDPHIAVDKVFDLFVELGAHDEQLDFPYIFASGQNGFAIRELGDEQKNLAPLLDLILEHCPPPVGQIDAPLQMQVTILDYSDYLGRLAIGRIYNGSIGDGQQVVLIKEDGEQVRGKISKLFTFKGLDRTEVKKVTAGQIVGIAGFANANVGDTITNIDQSEALHASKLMSLL